MVPPTSTRFHVSRGTLDPAVPVRISCTGLSPSLAGFPKTIPLSFPVTYAVHNPSMHARWFRLLPFRSPLLWESSFLSFLRLLRCFSSPGSLPYVMDWRMDTRSLSVGFPIRIPADQWIFYLPMTFATYHVLHRL